MPNTIDYFHDGDADPDRRDSAMTPQARALAQALLAHRREVCQAALTRDSSVDSFVITYADLCERAGLAHIKPTIGKFLREIAEWCHDNKWPPLNSLAVNSETRRPGRGYDRAPGCHLERWSEDATRCIYFTGYPEAASETGTLE
jgi:hypothetical protein